MPNCTPLGSILPTKWSKAQMCGMCKECGAISFTNKTALNFTSKNNQLEVTLNSYALCSSPCASKISVNLPVQKLFIVDEIDPWLRDLCRRCNKCRQKLNLINCRRSNNFTGNDEKSWRSSVDLLLSSVFIVNLRNFLFANVSQNLFLDLTWNSITNYL